MFFHGSKHCLFDTDVSVDLPVYLLSQGPSWARAHVGAQRVPLRAGRLQGSRDAQALSMRLKQPAVTLLPPDRFARARGACVSAGGLAAPWSLDSRACCVVCALENIPSGGQRWELQVRVFNYRSRERFCLLK